MNLKFQNIQKKISLNESVKFYSHEINISLKFLVKKTFKLFFSFLKIKKNQKNKWKRQSDKEREREGEREKFVKRKYYFFFSTFFLKKDIMQDCWNYICCDINTFCTHTWKHRKRDEKKKTDGKKKKPFRL